MKIVHWGRARQFFQAHKDSEDSLEYWKVAVTAAHWKDFAQLKNTFASAQQIDGKIVFELGCGNYLIAIAHFEGDNLYIFRVLAEQEFVSGLWQL